MIIVSMIVAGAAAYLITLLQAPVYGAEARVLVETNVFVGGAEAEQLMETQKVIVASQAVLQPAATKLGVSIESLDDELDVEVITGTNVLRIEYRGPRPELAVTRASSIVASYIDPNRRLSGRFPETRVRPVVVTPAHVMEDPVRPKPERMVPVSAVVAGLVVGGLFFLLRSRQSSR